MERTSAAASRAPTINAASGLDLFGDLVSRCLVACLVLLGGAAFGMFLHELGTLLGPLGELLGDELLLSIVQRIPQGQPFLGDFFVALGSRLACRVRFLERGARIELAGLEGVDALLALLL